MNIFDNNEEMEEEDENDDDGDLMVSFLIVDLLVVKWETRAVPY